MTNLPSETLECIMDQMGESIGAVLRCVIQQEIQSHMDRIIQLQNILQTGICVPTAETTNLPASQ